MKQEEAIRRQVHDAFAQRDVGAIRTLFRDHPSLRAGVDAPVFGFDSPAIVAYANDLPMVEVLLELGADPNRRSTWWAGGFHALHSATGAAAARLIAGGAVMDACAAAHLGDAAALRAMLAADAGRVHERGGDGKTPLHFASTGAVVDLLLQAGADIDARDVDHRSTAAQWMLDRKHGAGRYELAESLVQRGAEADIFLRAALGHTEHVRSMLRADPALLDLRTGQGHYGEQPPSSYHIYFWTIGSGCSPIDVARQFSHADTLQVMLEHASPVQGLLHACRYADSATAHAIVDAHPGIVGSMTPAQHRALADAAWTGRTESVALMSALGFDASVTGHDSGTALHLAAWEGLPAMVRVLLDRPDATRLLSTRDARYGASPLGWCCFASVKGNTSRDHAEVARLLVAAGAEPGEDAETASAAVRLVLSRSA